jgi:hypothetical protein
LGPDWAAALSDELEEIGHEVLKSLVALQAHFDERESRKAQESVEQMNAAVKKLLQVARERLTGQRALR